MLELGPTMIGSLVIGAAAIVIFLHMVARHVADHADRVELLARASALREQYRNRVEAFRRGEALSEEQFTPVADSNAA